MSVTRKMKSSIAMMPEPHTDTLERFTCPFKNLRVQQKDLSELRQLIAGKEPQLSGGPSGLQIKDQVGEEKFQEIPG